MAGRVAGKVAFITGAARGQGRSHAIRLAEEGADIIAVDICETMPPCRYGMATEADLAETVKAVEALDRRIVATKADVRDAAALKAALDDGVAQLGTARHRLRQRRHLHRAGLGRGDPGGLAGHPGHQPDRRLEHDGGRDPAPDRGGRRVDHLHQLDRGHQGPALPGARTSRPSTAWSASPGRMANELAKHKIRVNTVHPTGVDTPMVNGPRRPRALIDRDPELGPIYHEHPAGRDRRAGRHHQRHAVAGLRRGPLRHRPGVHRRRGQHDQR